MNQHTEGCKRYNHYWLQINNRPFFSKRPFFSNDNILYGGEKQRNKRGKWLQSSDLMMKNRFGFEENMFKPKLNTVYCTFTVLYTALYCAVELGWHAFYNQLLYRDKRNRPLLATNTFSESLCPSDNESNSGEIRCQS